MFTKLGRFSPAAGVQYVLPSERLCVCAYQCGLGVCVNVLHPKNVRGNFKSQTHVAVTRTQKPREREQLPVPGHPGCTPVTQRRNYLLQALSPLGLDRVSVSSVCALAAECQALPARPLSH